MKIISCKKKLIGISLGLIVIGILITGIGFGMQGFGVTKQLEYNTHKWYQTIRIDNGSWSYGVNIGDGIHLMYLGN